MIGLNFINFVNDKFTFLKIFIYKIYSAIHSTFKVKNLQKSLES